MTNKFEQLLELLINEEQDKAEALFHEIVVEKSRDIYENLADSELVFLATSSDKLIIFETLIPAAGSNSFKVTTGPRLTFFIFPSTPKSNKIFSKKVSSILLFDGLIPK